MKVLSNPDAPKDNGTRVDVCACPCIEVVNCAWELEVLDPTTYKGLSLNGKTVERPVPPVDGVELISFILEDLATAGGYEFGELTYEGTTLKYNEAAQLIPNLFINGFNVTPETLCNKVKYCTFEYSSAEVDPTLITVDGVQATDVVYEGGKYTITAPSGSDVQIDGSPVQPCGCGIIKWESADEEKK